MVSPAFLPPVPLKFIGGFGLPWTGLIAPAAFGAFVPTGWTGPDVLAVRCSIICKSLALLAVAVPDPVDLPAGAMTLLLGAFCWGAERLTLYELACCAKAETLRPRNTIASDAILMFLFPA